MFEQESRQRDHSAQAVTDIRIAPSSHAMCASMHRPGNASQF
jgi:hypothetical protein